MPSSHSVGLRPKKGWARRNYRYVCHSLLPTMVQRKEPAHFDFETDFYRPIPAGQMEVVWIGHASFFIRTATHNILIDPVWDGWIGPIKRRQDPGIPIDLLPHIDVILISHAHFDHLSMKTLRKICCGQETILVPEGVSSVLKGIPHASLCEMSEWQEVSLDGGDLQITFTPCHHWGARYITDHEKGFGGFLIDSAGHTLYHSGDTAYFDGFAEIGARSQIDTALLPIGAYDTPSGRETHMNPEEALLAYHDLSARQMIPMHFGTFPISMEAADEPLMRLREAVASSTTLSENAVLTPRVGERVMVK